MSSFQEYYDEKNKYAKTLGGGLESLGFSANPYMAAFQVGGNIMGAMGDYAQDQRNVTMYNSIGDSAKGLAKNWKGISNDYGDLAQGYMQGGKQFNNAVGMMSDAHMASSRNQIQNMASQGVNSISMNRNIYKQADDATAKGMAGLQSSMARIAGQYLGQRDQAQSMFDQFQTQADSSYAMAQAQNKRGWEYIPQALGF